MLHAVYKRRTAPVPGLDVVRFLAVDGVARKIGGVRREENPTKGKGRDGGCEPCMPRTPKPTVTYFFVAALVVRAAEAGQNESVRRTVRN